MPQGTNVSMAYVEKTSAKAGTELILQVETIILLPQIHSKPISNPLKSIPNPLKISIIIKQVRGKAIPATVTKMPFVPTNYFVGK